MLTEDEYQHLISHFDIFEGRKKTEAAPPEPAPTRTADLVDMEVEGSMVEAANESNDFMNLGHLKFW